VSLLCLSKNEVAFKIIIWLKFNSDQSQANGDFKSHLIFRVTQEELLALLGIMMSRITHVWHCDFVNKKWWDLNKIANKWIVWYYVFKSIAI